MPPMTALEGDLLHYLPADCLGGCTPRLLLLPASHTLLFSLILSFSHFRLPLSPASCYLFHLLTGTTHFCSLSSPLFSPPAMESPRGSGTLSPLLLSFCLLCHFSPATTWDLGREEVWTTYCTPRFSRMGHHLHLPPACHLPAAYSFCNCHLPIRPIPAWDPALPPLFFSLDTAPTCLPCLPPFLSYSFHRAFTSPWVQLRHCTPPAHSLFLCSIHLPAATLQRTILPGPLHLFLLWDLPPWTSYVHTLLLSGEKLLSATLIWAAFLWDYYTTYFSHHHRTSP